MNNRLAEWGEVIFILTLLSLAQIVTLFGQNVKFIKEEINHTYWQMQVNVLVLSACISSLFVIMNKLVMNEIATTMKYASILLIPYSSTILYTSFLQKSDQQSLVFAIFNTQNYIFILLLAISFLFEFDSKNTLSTIIFGAFILSILHVCFLGENKIISRIRLLDANILRSSSVFMLTSAAFFVLNWTDTLLIGLMKGDEYVGGYNILFKTVSLLTLVLSLLNAMVAPRISTEFKLGASHLGALIRPFNRVAALCGVVFFVLIIGLRKYILLDLFKVNRDSLFVELEIGLVVLCIGYLVNCISGNVGLVLQMTGFAKLFGQIIGVSAIINLLLNIILVPLYGLVGATMATAFSMIFWNVTSFIFVVRKLKCWPI